MSGDTRDIYDTAFPILLHDRTELLARQQRAGDEIHIEVFLPVFYADLFKRVFGADCDPRIVPAGRVYQDSRRAESIRQAFPSRFERLPVQGVSENELGDAATLSNGSDSLLSPLLAPSKHDNFGSDQRQAVGDRPAQYPGTTHHHCYFSGQVKQVHFWFTLSKSSFDWQRLQLSLIYARLVDSQVWFRRRANNFGLTLSLRPNKGHCRQGRCYRRLAG
jgi:hypothetical protein